MWVVPSAVFRYYSFCCSSECLTVTSQWGFQYSSFSLPHLSFPFHSLIAKVFSFDWQVLSSSLPSGITTFEYLSTYWYPQVFRSLLLLFLFFFLFLFQLQYLRPLQLYILSHVLLKHPVVFCFLTKISVCFILLPPYLLIFLISAGHCSPNFVKYFLHSFVCHWVSLWPLFLMLHQSFNQYLFLWSFC